MTNPILIDVTRGPMVESRHRGLVVIARPGGPVAVLGHADMPVYSRSSLKMIQALPLVESGAASRFQVSPAELALACASHSGEPQHTGPVAAWLNRLGLGEADLDCGPHPPTHTPSAEALYRAGESPCRLHNNCSGKHTGFLTLAKDMGAPTVGYDEFDHPVQRAIRARLSALTDVPEQDFATGIDGCNAPNYALPPSRLAVAFARLAAGISEGGNQLIAAVRAHPELVAGTGRGCTRMIKAAGGGTVVKAGAEGFYVAAIPALKLGVALKIDDGAGRAAEAAMAAVLEGLGLLPEGFGRTAVKNTRAREVGMIQPAPDWVAGLTAGLRA